MSQSLVHLFILVFFVALILGIVVFMIRKAPFILGEWKQGLEWLAYLIALLIVVFAALPIAGISY